MKVKCDHRSKFSNLSNWKEEAWKKSGLQRDSNPWPPRYRCDALPTELWSHTLGARSIYWVHFFPCSEIMWNIYEIIHICNNSSHLYCGMRWKWSVIIAVNFPIISNWKEEASHRYRGGHGFEPRWSPDFFFRLLLSNCLNWKIYCDDHTQFCLLLVFYYDANLISDEDSLLLYEMFMSNWLQFPYASKVAFTWILDCVCVCVDIVLCFVSSTCSVTGLRTNQGAYHCLSRQTDAYYYYL